MTSNKPSYEELEFRIAELKQQNEMLQLNTKIEQLAIENHYLYLFENLPDGTVLYKLIYENNTPVDLVCLDANRAAEILIGRNDLNSCKFTEIFPGVREQNQDLFHFFCSFPQSDSTKKFEVYSEFLKKWLSISLISPAKDFFIAIFNNITARKETERKPKDSEKRFRILFEQAAVGVAQIDTQTGRFIRINKKYSEIIGYTNEEMQDINFQTITYTSDLIPDLQNMELLKQDEIQEFTMQKRLLHKSGRIIWVELSVSAMWKKGDKPDYHIAVVSDITHQKKSELELKKLSVAVEQSPVTIAITDLKGNIEYVNPAFCKITGYDFDEAIGKQTSLLNSGKTPIETFKNMWQTINSGKTWDGEFINKRKNGELYYEEAVISPVFDENNKIAHFIAIKNDISEKKQQEEQIKQNNNQLKELNATKDKFFGIIAHDLKNPFSSILGFSDLLAKNLHRYNEDKTLQFVQTIRNSAQNAYKLLENLLEWSRSQTGKIEFKPELTILENLIIEIIELTNSNSLAKNIHVSYEINESIVVHVDKNMINTILRNLVTNAIKYTNKNGTVKITASRIDKNILISVIDNGVGINEEMINNLFRISEKISIPGTENERGTGLGLILCKEFVEKHGGKIWVESEIDKGSTFHFTIPA